MQVVSFPAACLILVLVCGSQIPALCKRAWCNQQKDISLQGVPPLEVNQKRR